MYQPVLPAFFQNESSHSQCTVKKTNVNKTEIYPEPYSILHDFSKIHLPEQVKYTNNRLSSDKEEEMKKTHKPNNKKRSRNSLRYMTQPITLLEIREADEDFNETTSSKQP
jgi:hypothetical protein